MSTFSLFSTTDTDVTVISNYFIDEYMPSANGSFVKIYLYLLRCFQDVSKEVSLSLLAENLDESEKDINRGITYWEKASLLRVSRSGHKIESITFLFPKPLLESEPKSIASEQEPLKKEQATTIEITPTFPPNASTTIHKPNYSDSQIKGLTDMEEVKWIMNTVERLLERLLKPMDVQLILFLYESVGFPADLIFYLYEYCVSKNKKNAAYIETVAISWAEDGIDTVEKAETATFAYNNNYSAVNKAFGLNRAPGSIEKKFMHRWFHEFNFDIALIEEACNRTILTAGKPDFKYADKILENWHNKGVTCIPDIAKLDEEHSRQATLTVTNKQNAAKQPASTNRFNSFPQRKYSEEDLLSMEQRLLNNR